MLYGEASISSQQGGVPLLCPSLMSNRRFNHLGEIPGQTSFKSLKNTIGAALRGLLTVPPGRRYSIDMVRWGRGKFTPVRKKGNFYPSVCNIVECVFPLMEKGGIR